MRKHYYGIKLCSCYLQITRNLIFPISTTSHYPTVKLAIHLLVMYGVWFNFVVKHKSEVGVTDGVYIDVIDIWIVTFIAKSGGGHTVEQFRVSTGQNKNKNLVAFWYYIVQVRIFVLNYWAHISCSWQYIPRLWPLLRCYWETKEKGNRRVSFGMKV